MSVTADSISLVSDEVTTAIAIIGAATGIGGLTIQGIVALRDRSRLRLKVDVRTLFGKPPRLVIDVLNDSPRATTVREVGLYAHPVRIDHMSHQTGEASRGVAEIDFPFTERPFFIEANEIRAFAGVPDIFNYGIHADSPLRVYAIDARNRRVWGDAAPYFRFVVGENPPVQPNDDESIKRALEPDGKTRHPWPVEPRWKIWKRRELRRSSEEAGEFRAMQKAAGGTLRIRGGVRRFDPDEQRQETTERGPS